MQVVPYHVKGYLQKRAAIETCHHVAVIVDPCNTRAMFYNIRAVTWHVFETVIEV